MPAKYRPAQSSSKIVLTIGLIFGCLSLVFVPLGCHLIKLEQRFETEALTVPGTITSKRVSEKRERDRNSKRETVSKTYYLQYRFTTGEGREMETEMSVSKSRWESAQTNEPVEIQYLPDDPEKSRIAGESGQIASFVFTGIGIVGALIGLASIGSYLRTKIATRKGKSASAA
jgi:hypothetical protein